MKPPPEGVGPAWGGPALGPWRGGEVRRLRGYSGRFYPEARTIDAPLNARRLG